MHTKLFNVYQEILRLVSTFCGDAAEQFVLATVKEFNKEVKEKRHTSPEFTDLMIKKYVETKENHDGIPNNS